MDLGMNGGRPRTRAALRTRCVRTPDAVRREKEMITALERSNVITLVVGADAMWTVAGSREGNMFRIALPE